MEDLLALAGRIKDASTEYSGLLMTVCYVLGATLVMQSFMKAKKISERGGQPGNEISGVFSRLFAGVVIFGIPALVGSISATVFGADASADPNSIFSLSPTAGGIFTDKSAQTALVGVLTFVQIMGVTGIVRGVMKLNKAVEEPGRENVGMGFTHIVGGIAAWNIADFIGIVDKFLLGSG